MPRALHAVASRYERADGASPRRRTGEPHADILGFAAIVGFCCFRRRRAGRRGAKRGQAVCEITGLRFAAEVAGMEMPRGGDAPRRGREAEMSRGGDVPRRGAKREPSGLRGLGVAIRGGGAGWRCLVAQNVPWRGCEVEMPRGGDVPRSGNPAVCGALGLRFAAEARDGRCFGAGIDRLRPVGAR